MDIKNCTDEELQKELDRRNIIEKPEQIENPDLTGLRKITSNYISAVISGESIDSDYNHYIYEAAMEALYGIDIFLWINKVE